MLESMSTIHQVHYLYRRRAVYSCNSRWRSWFQNCWYRYWCNRKTFEGRRRGQQTGMSQTNEESLAITFSSMSMDTEHSSYGDSQNGSNFNTPYQGSYGAYNIFDYHLPQMSYEISMHGDEQYPLTWVSRNYPIYRLSVGRNKSIYTWHINN